MDVSLVVPAQDTAAVKRVLVEHAAFDRSRPVLKPDAVVHLPLDRDLLQLAGVREGTYGLEQAGKWLGETLSKALGGTRRAGLQVLVQRSSTTPASSFKRSLRQALEEILGHEEAKDELLALTPRYETFHPYASTHAGDYVLLQATAFQQPAWVDLLQRTGEAVFMQELADKMGVGHLARKSKIQRDDPVRRPRIEPLHGEFGDASALCPGDGTYWAKATQTVKLASGKSHAIHYVFAPSHTMFSRGNFGLKQRLATASLPDIVHFQPSEGRQLTVVDLFAGIGYWIIPFVLSGAGKAFACDLNPWSLEGLRRGCKVASIACSRPGEDGRMSNTTVSILEGDNAQWRSFLRHKAHVVSLGLLPTARFAYPLAISSLSLFSAAPEARQETCWLYVHDEVTVPHAAGAEKAKLQDEALQAWGQTLVVELGNLARKEAASCGQDAAELEIELVYAGCVKPMAFDLVHAIADISLRWVTNHNYVTTT